MGFTLVIAKGEQEGKSFAFDASARIGRNDDNDVVLDLPGISRAHARVYARDGRYFAEDLGSVNGTKVNGVKIPGPTELHHGDSVAVGQVLFAFVVKEAAVVPAAPAGDEAATQMMDGLPEELFTRPPAKAPPPEDSDTQYSSPPVVPDLDAKTSFQRTPAAFDDSETTATAGKAVGIEDVETRIGVAPPAPIERAETRILEAASLPPMTPSSRPSRVRPALGSEVEPTPIVRRSGVKDAIAPPPTGERRSGAKNAIAPERRSGVKPALAASAAPPKPAESAVDRARRRREANESLGKMLLFHWRELSSRTRYVVMGVAAAVVLGGVAAVVSALWPESAARPTGPEPTQLSTQAIADSFGLGPGVTWKRPDLKSFEFFFNTPTRAVAVLHYEAQQIGPDEVTISVNGVLQGSVPPDTTNSEEREIEQVLSSRDLKRNARNVVVFDNVHNPPGEDTWRISGLWLEVIPIPELPKDQLLASAREYAARGKQMYEQRDIGSSNLFLAWKNYRFAWLTLEAVDEKPELYQLVRYQLASIGRDLDRQCGVMMLAARKAYELHDRKKAKQVLEEVNSYFPTSEHRCHNLALEKLSQFDL